MGLQKQHRLPPRLSPTALGSFATCPKQFAYSYILHEPVQETLSPHLILGNTIHQALAFLYRLSPAERNLEAAQQALRHCWAKIPNRSAIFFNSADEASWGHLGLDILSRYCQNNDLEISPLAIEKSIEAELPNGRKIFGKADRIDRLPTGGLEIIDYKTGRCRIETDQLNQVLAARLYALAATRTFNEEVKRVRFSFLTDECERLWTLQEGDLDEIERELVAMTNQIHASSLFKARPDLQGHCRFCSYRSICPETNPANLESLSTADSVGC